MRQAVLLPAGCRFDATEVFVRRDPETGDVILSLKPPDWEGFFAALEGLDVPSDVANPEERRQAGESRDPFKGWQE